MNAKRRRPCGRRQFTTDQAKDQIEPDSNATLFGLREAERRLLAGVVTLAYALEGRVSVAEAVAEARELRRIADWWIERAVTR